MNKEERPKSETTTSPTLPSPHEIRQRAQANRREAVGAWLAWIGLLLEGAEDLPLEVYPRRQAHATHALRAYPWRDAYAVDIKEALRQAGWEATYLGDAIVGDPQRVCLKIQ